MHHFRLSADQNGLQTIYRQIETENVFSRSMSKSNRQPVVDKSRMIISFRDLYRSYTADHITDHGPWSLSNRPLQTDCVSQTTRVRR